MEIYKLTVSSYPSLVHLKYTYNSPSSHSRVARECNGLVIDKKNGRVVSLSYKRIPSITNEEDFIKVFAPSISEDNMPTQTILHTDSQSNSQSNSQSISEKPTVTAVLQHFMDWNTVKVRHAKTFKSFIF